MPKKAVPKKNKKNYLRSHFLYLCSCCAVIILLFLSSFNLSNFLNKDRVLGASVEDQNQTLLEEKTFWENFLSKNPTYLDGWLELAKIENQLGDKNYALGALNTAKAINPNSEKVKEIEKTLGF